MTNEHESILSINASLKLIQDGRHFPFGSDALLLAAFPAPAARAAELGAGSGAVSLLAAARGKFREIVGYELQESACDLFLRNVRLNGLEGVVFPECRDIRDLPGTLAGTFDCVFSNPPYMKINAGKTCLKSERQIARHETAGDISDFCRAAALLLRFGGEAAFVYRPDRLCDLLSAMRKSGIEPKRITAVCRDYSYAPSVVLVSGKKGGAPGLFCSPVFFVESAPGVKTPEYSKLMNEGAFDERFLKP